HQHRNIGQFSKTVSMPTCSVDCTAEKIIMTVHNGSSLLEQKEKIMANTIPGADALGFGFNTLGNYGLGSVTSQIFAHKNNDAQNWVYEPTGIQYDVPDNIAVENTTSVSGQSYVFSSQQQFQSHFASSIHADISADFGTFQGAFNASYGTDTTTTGSYYYGVYEANYNGWSLVIEDDTQQWLSPGFIQDPEIGR